MLEELPGGHFDPKPLFKLMKDIFIGRFRLVLKTFADIPEYLKTNPHIISGYRVDYRKRDCLRSVFRLHNETFNILTHLAGTLIFMNLICDSVSRLWNEALQHTLVLVLYLVSALQCLVSSTVYHIFSAHSVCTFERLLSLDYSGITFLIFGSQVPVVYYLFYHEPWLKWGYMSGLVAISWYSYYVSHAPDKQSEEYTMVRVAAFAANALYASVCLVHVLAVKGFYREELYDLVYFIALMYVFYGCGVFIYSNKIPERFKPGLFDIVLHSHQIWHCLVVAAALSQYYACTTLFELYKATSVLSV